MQSVHNIKVYFVREGVEKLVSCYRQHHGSGINLFVVQDPISVFWSDFSLIQADLECIEILLARDAKWKFFINQVTWLSFVLVMKLLLGQIKENPDI